MFGSVCDKVGWLVDRKVGWLVGVRQPAAGHAGMFHRTPHPPVLGAPNTRPPAFDRLTLCATPATIRRVDTEGRLMRCTMERTIDQIGPETWLLRWTVNSHGVELVELLAAELAGSHTATLTATTEWLDGIAEVAARDRFLWGGTVPIVWDGGPLHIDIEVSEEVRESLPLDVNVDEHHTPVTSR